MISTLSVGTSTSKVFQYYFMNDSSNDTQREMTFRSELLLYCLRDESNLKIDWLDKHADENLLSIMTNGEKCSYPVSVLCVRGGVSADAM
jgi:hypothetical protein